MNVLMPQLGETVNEGTISKWYKSIGDAVTAGDVLFEIETDKTSMEVPAIVSGILTEIKAEVGQTVPVGAVVSVLRVDGAAESSAEQRAIPATSPTPAVAATQIAPTPAPPVTTAPVKRELDPFNAVRSPERNFGLATLANGTKVTPLARRLAVQAGVDLNAIEGSGPHGRIVAADIKEVAQRAQPLTTLASSAGLEQVKALYSGVAYREVSLDGMRKTIAKRLVESKQTVPHFYLTADMSVDALLAQRAQINATGKVRVTINDCIVKAYALALQRVTAANAAWADDRLLQFERVDVGVAVAINGGLVTPIVRSADTKSLAAISAEVVDLATRARDRKLKPAEYQGGSGTVSNLGMYGVREFSAIINPPQATILAVGAAERRPVEKADGSIGFANKLTVTLSVDHRVVDGAVAGELLAAFKSIIETPISLLI
jgi:pyruvate dehydrogenase E2 component (dihydrolipoamide acetyltransferase)